MNAEVRVTVVCVRAEANHQDHDEVAGSRLV